MRIGIVGAGVTGCLLANKLTNSGADVTVLEKSRGTAGRACHKKTEWGSFDMGAPVIPAYNDAFLTFMERCVSDGVAVRWPDKAFTYNGELNAKNDDADEGKQPVTRYAFPRGVNDACQRWLQGSELKTQAKVAHFQRLPEGWLLWDEQEGSYGLFDSIVMTAPWPQTRLLLEDIPDADEFTGKTSQNWTSCWSVAMEIAQPINTHAKLIHVEQSDIQVVCLDTSKTLSRSPNIHQTWVVYFSHEFSDRHPQIDEDALLATAKQTLCDMFGVSALKVTSSYRHYWRFARPALGEAPIGIFQSKCNTVFAGGDWSFGASFQAAFQASNSLFESIIAQTTKEG
ncbi:NAD(P)-binding protein [Aestuariibacter sp. AA17]|uniref:NAD(P)-binding protein n=1 Tax=Fluctibacter corallii TaxID=2984329 RepID=A0ABT3AAE7_9ALTE|nr:NAD(P)-binding protein [Aestuariibacter sp. AA17]MCV2885560.1 NAD(P)-binding protein [Aestuariibacter sp. AA17]